MLQTLYDKVLRLARHQHAERYLCAVSFADSSFFPITPLVMLIPMALGQPNQAMRFALVTTLASALGGVFGYCIGYFLFETIAPWLQTTHYWQDYLQAKNWVEEWGIWAILIGGFLPIPYKVFTIAAGTLHMMLLPFLLVSTLGRGGRFCLVAFLLKMGGQPLEEKLRKYINKIGWLCIGGLLVAALVFHFSHS
jgi:membrane protein YqaA with SNARE-associated domain